MALTFTGPKYPCRADQEHIDNFGGAGDRRKHQLESAGCSSSVAPKP